MNRILQAILYAGRKGIDIKITPNYDPVTNSLLFKIAFTKVIAQKAVVLTEEDFKSESLVYDIIIIHIERFA
jgi:hypothetical protein